MTLAAEAAKLVEIFQWLTPDESTAVRDSQSQKQSVEGKLADILNYNSAFSGRARHKP
jgi:hypothetical protein